MTNRITGQLQMVCHVHLKLAYRDQFLTVKMNGIFNRWTRLLFCSNVQKLTGQLFNIRGKMQFNSSYKNLYGTFTVKKFN